MFDWLSEFFNDSHDIDIDGVEGHNLHEGLNSHLGGGHLNHFDMPIDHHVDALQGAPEHIQALYSLDRMTDHIDGFDLEGMKSFVEEKSFDSQSYQGLVSNWKGIYGEIRAVEELNATSHDGLHYVLPQSTNNPDVDIYGLDNNGNIQEMIQVKMTNNPEYIQQALDKLPEGVQLMCTSEVANALHDPRIIDAGFSHADLMQDISDTMEVLNTPESWENSLTPEFHQWLSEDFSFDPGLATVSTGE